MRARRRSKLAKTEIDPRFATSTTSGVPFVLTPEAVRECAMPPLGSSGMPASLEKSVPAFFRFWKADDIDAARSTRDALVEAGIFTDSTIFIVDDEPIRVLTKHFVAEVEEVEGVTLMKRDEPLDLAQRLIIGKVFDFRDRDFDPTIVGGDDWGVVMKNDEKSVALAKSVEGMTFRVSTRPDLIFVSKWAPRDSMLVEFVDDRITMLTKSAISRVRFMKADDGLSLPVEERYVLGIVLEPEVEDAQADIYSADEIRKAAHNFLENYGAIGLQHSEIVTGKIKILESYLAPADMMIGGQTVKAGTWLLGVRVLDDTIWSAVKDGSYTGFSIGGSAVRTPVA